MPDTATIGSQDAAALRALQAENAQLRIENVRLRVELAAARHAARHDPLTALPNRTALGDGDRLLADAHRLGLTALVAVLDLNGFKAINDTLGHDAGDMVLVETGRRLATIAAQATGLAIRLGGDEFVLILIGSEGETALRERLAIARERLGAPIPLAGRSVRVWPTIGAAVADEDTSLRCLIGRSDMAMYRARRTGVGTAVWTPGVDPAPPLTEDDPPRPPTRRRDMDRDRVTSAA